MKTVLEKARNFIYKNARPLDLARWQYHFEDGSREAVLRCLSCYQNEDGGFGHALEADSWNPNSAPIQTWTATEILREIEFTDASHPIIQGILRYLESGRDFDGKMWFNQIKSNNDYPHAPWWHVQEGAELGIDNYNPTAALAGFILRFAKKGSPVYELAARIAKEAVEWLLPQEEQNDMHILACYIRLAQYVEAAGAEEIMDLTALKEKLRALIPTCITGDFAKWEKCYACRPSQFFQTKDSLFYKDNQEAADYECEFLKKTQFADGSWMVPWGWAEYPEEWAVSKNWWKSTNAIQNLLYLKGMQ